MIKKENWREYIKTLQGSTLFKAALIFALFSLAFNMMKVSSDLRIIADEDFTLDPKCIDTPDFWNCQDDLLFMEKTGKLRFDFTRFSILLFIYWWFYAWPAFDRTFGKTKPVIKMSAWVKKKLSSE